MRTIIQQFLLLLLSCMPLGLSAQLFNGVNYQAVLRDALGEPMINQTVTLWCDIREGTPTGPFVFGDAHSVTTDAHGLVSLVIGKGSSVTGDLGALDFAATDYFLEISINGSAMPVQRLEAVPMSYKATNMELSDLTDVDGSSPSSGQVLQWDGSDWKPVTMTGTGGGGSLWTENTANGIESLTQNVGIGSNAHNNKRLFIECDSIPTGILVINNDGSPGPEVPQGVISLVTVVDKSEGTALVGYAVTGSNTVDSLFGVRTIADAQGGNANVFGAHCEAYGTGNGNKYGFYGRASGSNSFGVFGTTSNINGFGIYGRNEVANGTAGYFEGKLFTDSWFSVDDKLLVRPNAVNSAIKLDMKNAADINTVELFAAGSNQGGGKIWVSDASGDTRISLAVNNAGIGRVITDELEIKGGSDLAEYFEASDDEKTIQPGQVVVIDIDRPGKIKVSSAANDKRVIGIVSGANGVKSGMMMGQECSEVYGDVPVAIAGRAYVQVDQTSGTIQPGDMLTTSPTLGSAMKVMDWNEARGAIIGKALTKSDENGYVLVLVNLQ